MPEDTYRVADDGLGDAADAPRTLAGRRSTASSSGANESSPLTTTRDARRRRGTGASRARCSLWTLNACAAALHGAWVIVFCLLWALDTRANGDRKDSARALASEALARAPFALAPSVPSRPAPPVVSPTSARPSSAPPSVTYYLYVSRATFGPRPTPPSFALDAPAAVTRAVSDARPTLAAAYPDLFGPAAVPGLSSPYPECDVPKSAAVGDMAVSPAWEDSGVALSLHWLVVAFFALSFVFQAAVAVGELAAFARLERLRRFVTGERYVAEDPQGEFFGGGGDDESYATKPTSGWMRFVEYSFSAAVMIVAIALQVGVFDAWMLFALAALTWATMILGLLAERILAVEEALARTFASAGDTVTTRVHVGAASDVPSSRRAAEHQNAGDVATAIAASCVGLSLPFLRWTAHFAGWITMGVVYVVIVAHFFTSQRGCEFADAPGGRDENVAPDFVYAIVFCELALFASFGITQLSQFVLFDDWRQGGPGRANVGRRAEAAYIVQSLVSKTLLGWLVYGGNFA